jgi:tetratricopeptide (TPR) repeat protein
MRAIINIIALLLSIVLTWLQYRKDKKTQNPKKNIKLLRTILFFTLAITLLNQYEIVLTMFRPEEEVAKVKHFKDFKLEILKEFQKFEIPSKKKVESELQGEFDAVKKKAITEYQIGITAYDNANFQEAIKRFQNALNIVKIPSLYAALGSSYFAIRQNEKGLEEMKVALNQYKQENDKKGETFVLVQLGMIYASNNDLKNGLRYINDALSVERKINNYKGEAAALLSMGIVHLNINELDKALRYFEDARNIGKRNGDLEIEAGSLYMIGVAHKIKHYGNKDEIDIALKYFNDAYNVVQKTDSTKEFATDLLVHIGDVYRIKKDKDTALSYYQNVLNNYQKAVNRRNEAVILERIGYLKEAEEFDTAMKYYRKALGIYRDIGDLYGEVNLLWSLCIKYDSKGNFSQALKYCQDALSIA